MTGVGVLRLKLVFLFSLLSFSACSETDSARTKEVELVYQSQHCQIQKAKVRLLDNVELQTVMNTSRPFHINLNTDPIQLEADEQAILVAWGAKPNSGFRLKLDNLEASVEEGILYLPVSFIEPKAGLLTAQVMTSPCLILKTKKDPSIKQIVTGPYSS